MTNGTGVPPAPTAPGASAPGAVPAVRLHGITKVYPGVRANDGIDLDFAPGSIHGLLGENGAGKSTLMKVLFGLIRPDAGTVDIDGRAVTFHSPADALAAGIGMVQQHFSLIDDFTVAQNLVLGAEPRSGDGWKRLTLDLGAADREVQALADRFGFRLDARRRVGTLAVGARQRVEILKALYRGAQVLILDEPTAALAPQEVRELVDVLHGLRAQGRTVVFISHKLPEVIELCDRVSVLRDGRVVGHREIADAERTDPARHEALAGELARMMVGRDLPEPPAHDGVPGAVLLELHGAGDGERLGPIDVDVRAGEIVGIAGVEGNGQTELIELVVGVRPCRTGRIALDGNDITHWPVAKRLSAGLAHVAEDRHAAAVAADLSLADNSVLGRHSQAPFVRGRVWFSLREVLGFARGVVSRFHVRAGSVRAPVSSLSGGNQQKLVVGRELSRNPRLMIAAQPTRGLDVGATAFVHQQLADLRSSGAGVLLVSLELTEVLALADRIVVLSGGKVAGRARPGEVDLETLGAWMTGATAAAVAEAS